MEYLVYTDVPTFQLGWHDAVKQEKNRIKYQNIYHTSLTIVN